MRLTAYLASLTALAAASIATAAPIPFDPDGPGPAPVVQAGSFDFLPGNILIVPGQSPAGGMVTDIYYQARLGAVLDPAGQVIPMPGLNTNYEITAVFGLTAPVIALAPNAAVIGGPGPLALNGYFSIYFDGVTNASDLAGTGFRNGVRILSADPTGVMGSFAGFAAGIPLDSFNPTNYPGITSDFLSGGLKVSANTLAVLPAFFPAGPAFSLAVDTTLAAPYYHTDPSANFDIGPDGFVVPTPALIGPVNGHGPMSVLESDGAVGFLPVPEPASLSLLAFGALPLLRRRRA